MVRTIRMGCAVGLLPLSSLVSAATVEDLMDMSLSQLSDIQVSIATGAPKSLTEAPAGTSVITASDLKAMGAQTLDEALESIPGLHVSRSSLNYAPRYFFRGVVSSYNPQTLLLVNGVPMSRLFFGDRGERVPNEYTLPVNIIERIEIIRGPGSALYGADAFAGVINVITKGEENMSASTVTTSVGSFETSRASLATPFEFAGARSAFMLSYLNTEGDDDVVIKSDRQTNFDNLGLAPPVSEAPASASLQASYYDARLDMSWDQLRLRAGWRDAWDVGNGYGTGSAIDPEAEYVYKDANLDLTWLQKDLAPDLDLETQVVYIHSYLRSSGVVQLFPPGAFFGALPEGMRAYVSVAEENARFNLKAVYRGFASRVLTMGSGYYWGDLYKTEDVRNYDISTGAPVQLTDYVNVADSDNVFQPEAQRTNYFFYVQDEWQFARNWELTTGVRYDDYDDVGASTNPRLSLLWHTTNTLTSKLMYGEAFRVPVFSELYAQSNSVALGNEALKPEKLQNVELGFAWEPSRDFSTTLNIYRYRIRDYIDFLPDVSTPTFTAQNSGRITGQGAEVELRYSVDRSLSLLANYAIQHAKDAYTHQPLGIAPKEEAYLRMQWATDHWQVVPQLTWVGERERQPNDIRASLDGYVTLDLTVRRYWPNGVSLAGIVRNLGDANVLEPSQGPSEGSQEPYLIYDLPQQGRSLTVELEVSF